MTPEGIHAEVRARLREAGEGEVARNRKRAARAARKNALAEVAGLPQTVEAAVAGWTAEQAAAAAKVTAWKEKERQTAAKAVALAVAEARAVEALRALRAASVGFWWESELAKGGTGFPSEQALARAGEGFERAISGFVKSIVSDAIREVRAGVNFLVEDMERRRNANAARGRATGQGAPMQDNPKDRAALRSRVMRAWGTEVAAAARAKRKAVGREIVIERELKRFQAERAKEGKGCEVHCTPDYYSRLFFRGKKKAGRE